MTEVAEAARRFAETMSEIGRKAGPDVMGFRKALWRCESPIEQAFCLALFQIPCVMCPPGEFNLATLASGAKAIYVFPQQPILHYRADFLLVGTSKISAEPIFAIVECDGEDYHSTREQQRRDAARQEELARTGFTVIRFTGRELFRDPETVAARTIAVFKPHGWSNDVRQWVNNQRLRQALAELRKLAGTHG